jgi:O-antigen biosynthesis protein
MLPTLSSTETSRQPEAASHSQTLLDRPVVSGKFLFVGDEKLWVRGATYGAFRPDNDKQEYQDLNQIDRDFRQMAESGFNAVRIPHTVPPRALLDVAAHHGLRAMVGLSAEQYAGYLADRDKAPDIDSILRTRLRQVAGHPALLCYSLGNEISSSMVRWLGRRTVERYLERLYQVVKAEDPDGLVTYVNYPSTEYLDLPFLDFVCFNVYLESEERLRAYLARLQNLAGDRPLLMSELGLDSMRNGERQQARTLEWQIRTTFASGCSGAFVFSWTDEWYRGGADVDDWAFGLTDRDRRPKLALEAVQRAFAEVPFASPDAWPRMSVIVCVYNGEQTIRDCCEGLLELDYPDYEVIIVDDGSTDRTAELASEYPFQLIRTQNHGLSSARNTGLEAATGQIVAYTDGDARPDPHWLMYLAAGFQKTAHVGIGGWNLGPNGDGWIADCVTNAPGGPVHVLLSDSEAEHIPGCSMAFRKDALAAIGGFDPQFRAAGDDVDVCWRLQQRGWTLGFEPGAMVWHHHRNSVRAYWRQQLGYGRAEAMLERKWPEKYNAIGHLTWTGRLYGKGLTLPLGRGGRIYHGIWGSAPFQQMADPGPGLLTLLPLMPEWLLGTATLGVLALVGLAWTPLLAAAPLFAAAVAVPFVQAMMSARRARFSRRPRSPVLLLVMQATVAMMHMLQPFARLCGRWRHGLTVWRRRGINALSLPIARSLPVWIGRWRAPEDRLQILQRSMKSTGAVVLHGGAYDAWDLEVRSGLCGSSRLLMAVEDTGSGTQLVRVRYWPHCHPLVPLGLLLFAGLALVSAFDGRYGVAVNFAALTAFGAWRVVRDCGTATHTIVHSLKEAELTADGSVSEVDRSVSKVLDTEQEQA